MQCSWKVVLLLALAGIAIEYKAIRTFTSKSFNVYPIDNPVSYSVGQDMDGLDHFCDESPTSAQNLSKKTHILIFATTRSGSSFGGQLFNQHSDIFYLFEPLYHVHSMQISKLNFSYHSVDIQVRLSASRDLLRSLYDCDLYFLENYIKPTPINHVTDKLFRRGASKALCSLPVCDAMGMADTQNYEKDCKNKCGTLNLTLATESCKEHGHVAIKIIRVPDINDLRELAEDPRLNLKVLQMVRDPRGILASRREAFPEIYRLWRIWQATGQKPYDLDTTPFIKVCEDILNSVFTGLSQPSWLKGKYMLVRYEDLAKDPMRKTEEIYSFLGIPMDSNIERWIQRNTRGDETSSKRKFGTLRNSAAMAESWRLTLSYEIVKFTQSVCQPLLKQLGYKMVNSVQELKNLTYSLIEDKNFLPCL